MKDASVAELNGQSFSSTGIFSLPDTLLRADAARVLER
jgi:hypothetical protein